MAVGAFTEHALITAAIHVFEKLRRVRFLKCRLVHPNSEIRFAFSGMLRLSDGGRYVLVRNLHRPETFGPFGGVFKYHDGCRSILDELQFRPHDVGPKDDMKNDLRGFIPRKHLAKLTKWYSKNDCRESPTECLVRELREELGEIGIVHLKLPERLQFRRIRAVEEGPEAVPGQTYTQYRIFEVFEPTPSSSESLRFLEQLIETSRNHPNLLLAEGSELITGRSSNGSVIGHHAAYFLGKKRVRFGDPPFSSNK